MAVSTGYVTVNASSGGSHVVQVTSDSTGLTLASSFSALTATFASGAGAYTGTGYFAAGNSTGSTFGTVLATGFSSVLVGDGGTLSYNDTVSGATITSGNGNDTIASSGSNDTIDAGAGSNVLLLTGANDSVTTAGFDTIQGFGASSLLAINDGASQVIYQNGGSLTVGGSGVSDVYANATTVSVTGSGLDTFVFNQSASNGGSNVTVLGSSATGTENFWAGSGNVSLVGGSGNNLFAAGAGSATAVGGSGSNAFAVFADDTGSATSFTIDNFTASDYLALVDFASGTSVTLTSSGGNTTVKLGNGATITLTGVSSLNEAHGPNNSIILALPGNPLA